MRLALMVIAGIVVATWLWVRITYPHGISHCCASGLGAALLDYAQENAGWFPHGEATPEASFSRLNDGTNLLHWLRGKNVPLKVAQAAWEREGRLGPESCGWHYVEGLRADDDQGIAVAWDKAWGLDHNGKRIRGLAHEVIMVSGSHKSIARKEWPKFAHDQRELLAKVIAARPTNAPPMRWSDEETLGTNSIWRAK